MRNDFHLKKTTDFDITTDCYWELHITNEDSNPNIGGWTFTPAMRYKPKNIAFEDILLKHINTHDFLGFERKLYDNEELLLTFNFDGHSSTYHFVYWEYQKEWNTAIEFKRPYKCVENCFTGTIENPMQLLVAWA